MLIPQLKDLVQLKSAISSRSFMQEKTSNRSQGDYSSLFHGLGVEFETVRPYVVGDDVRYIDWRVTARIGKPQVKTFRAESDRNVLVVIDANSYMRFGTRGTFKSIQAAKTAALLCWKSVQQQDRVGGLVFGDVANGIQYFKPTKTDSATLRLLKTLCNQEIDLHAQVGVATALKHLARIVTPQSLVFVISDFSNDNIVEIEKTLITLRKTCKLVLLPLQDPADSNIPNIGQITFVNGQQQDIIDTDNSRARKMYHDAWENYRTSILHLSKKIKAPLLWIETALDPVKCLFAQSGSILTWKN
jgi:uncharacterized protein (DUF58 family)